LIKPSRCGSETSRSGMVSINANHPNIQAIDSKSVALVISNAATSLRPYDVQDSPIFQLQVTFAALQESTQNVFNPTKLVESLKLRTTEQQDAQEFVLLLFPSLKVFSSCWALKIFKVVYVSSRCRIQETVDTISQVAHR
jgi:hypothetical protein